MVQRIQIVGPPGRKEFSYISVSFYIKTLIIITIIGESFPAYSDACGSSLARTDAMLRKNNLFLNKKEKKGETFSFESTAKAKKPCTEYFSYFGIHKVSLN